GNLPEVAYITVADGLFLVAYVMTTAALVSSIASYFLHGRGREQAALRLDRAARVLMPLLSLLVAFRFLRPAPPPPPSRGPAALPPMERPAASRDVVRIGTLTLSSILASPAYAGLFWDVVHKEPSGEKHAVFVDVAPGVDSDTMRFLAGGELE